MSHTNKRKHYSSESSDNDYDDDAECGKYTVGGETHATDYKVQSEKRGSKGLQM